MKQRGPKKKMVRSPLKILAKKNRPKSKSKEKRFYAKDYLEALIDLQNTNCSTNRKKKTTKRDTSSALTLATPALQKTVSTSKIRSKSSFSQNKKKPMTEGKSPMTINLCAVITEEDNIQYTEKTARSQIENQAIPKQNITTNPIKPNRNLCAIKIQRAWRNYQTYKMVHRMFLEESKARQNGRQAKHAGHVNIKSDFEKTLKIKSEKLSSKQSRRNQEMSQTQKIIMERWKESRGKQSQEGSPILAMNDLSESSSNVHTSENILIQQIKHRQAQRLDQVIKIIEDRINVKSKDELLKQLVEKFESNKKNLESQINKRFQRIEFNERIPSVNSYSDENDVPNLELQQIPNQQFDQVSIKDYLSDSSGMCFDYESIADEQPEFKIFAHRLETLNNKKVQKILKVDEEIEAHVIEAEEGRRKKQRVYGRYERQKKQVEKNKKQYIFALTQLKKNAIYCHQASMRQSSSLSRIRKSFSVGCTVLKTVVDEMNILEISEDKDEISVMNRLFGDEGSLEAPQTPSSKNMQAILLPSPEKSMSELVLEKSNTELMKSCSEDIQEMIEKYLIDEFVKDAYMSEVLYPYFKPYVQEIYSFERITDEQIIKFTTEIQRYFPNPNIMLLRVNQKVNPTSIEILRIIRDIDYEIEEYELIIPEECFKMYRLKIEQQYERKSKAMSTKHAEIQHKIRDYKLAQKVFEREVDKQEKMKKYRNFERDLKIMYMKAIFNCINQFLIETKSSNSYMNGRSSIGPGELTLALKEYNDVYSSADYQKLLQTVQGKLVKTVNLKCSIPSFKSYPDLELFQKQITNQLKCDFTDTEFKWVNYMDEVLEIWQDVCALIISDITAEACSDILSIL